MQKIFFQFLLLIALFIGTWLLLGKINFVKYFEIKNDTGKLDEKKIGDLFWKGIQQSETENENDSVKILLNKIKLRLCEANKIDASTIKIHVIEKSEINAFAMPARHLIIYTQLIQDCKNAEELTGVMAHEIAHMEHDHVMKKIVKESGLAMLFSIAGGGAGGEVVKGILRKISSTAYDRSLESDADATAVQYLQKAEIDPEGFGNFLYRLGDENEKDMPKQLYWISTHPESKERAAVIFSLLKKNHAKKTAVLNDEEWSALQDLTK